MENTRILNWAGWYRREFKTRGGLLLILAGILGANTGYSTDLPLNGMSRTNSNTQASPIQLAVISIPDPVDIKWTGNSNLYVLSGNTATITELDANGKTVRSLSGIGSTPSGLDVDMAGNVYVAVTGDNQVRKFNSTDNSFKLDTKFGSDGYIGKADKSSGTNSSSFNAPFDVAVTPDSREISVSDSGNNRIQHFTKDGGFIDSFGKQFGGIGQLNSPKGLVYDFWNNLSIVDSGNNRIVIASDYGSQKASGGTGSGLGQFQAPWNLCTGKRGLYVADTGNNRVQVFAPTSSHELSSNNPLRPRLSLSGELGLNHPKAVAAFEDLLEEKFYIADTGNNRVLLVKLPLDNPEVVWENMKARLAVGDIPGALSYFSIASKDQYRETFLSLSKAELISDAKNIGTIKPVSIESDKAQYCFENVVDGHKITFPIEFTKENGQWKILEY